MGAKVTTVTLYNDSLQVTEEFEISHAERLLRLPNTGGWKLPNNSPYQFSLQYGFINRGNKERDNRTPKKGGNKSGDNPTK